MESGALACLVHSLIMHVNGGGWAGRPVGLALPGKARRRLRFAVSMWLKAHIDLVFYIINCLGIYLPT